MFEVKIGKRRSLADFLRILPEFSKNQRKICKNGLIIAKKRSKSQNSGSGGGFWGVMGRKMAKNRGILPPRAQRSNGGENSRF